MFLWGMFGGAAITLFFSRNREEKDVLNSIYDGDDRFKMLSDVSFQYKFGDLDNVTSKTFVIDFLWGPNYPYEKPEVNLNAFYNNHIIIDVKQDIVNQVLTEAELNIGSAMTYTLIEWVKENFDLLIAKQLEKPTNDVKELPTYSEENTNRNSQVQIKEKKVQLSKAQKRRMYDRGGSDAVKGEMPRGFDWIDVVKHLSQCGHLAVNSINESPTSTS